MAKTVKAKIKADRSALHVTRGGSTTIDADILVKELTKVTDKSLRDFLKKFSRALASGKGVQEDMRRRHERMAKVARNKVYASYQSTHLGRSSYRENDRGKKMKRYSGGVLGSLLKSSSTAWVKGNSLNFVNVADFNKSAKQWRRLNFGAGGQKPMMKETPIKIKGRSTGRYLSHNDVKHSGRMFMPAGMFIGKAFKKTSHAYGFVAKRGQMKGPYFYPAPKAKDKNGYYKFPQYMSPGHEHDEDKRGYLQGRGFLDAGLEYINYQYGREVTKAITSWMEKSKSEAIRGFSLK